MEPAIAEMLDGDVRKSIRDRCAGLPPMSGAAEAAAFIAESLKFVLTDFDIAEADARISSPR